MEVDEAGPGDLRPLDQLARRQRVENRLRQLPRVASRRFCQLQRNVRGEIAVRGVARALDVDDGADDVGGQDVGRQGSERGLDELFDPIFHVRWAMNVGGRLSQIERVHVYGPAYPAGFRQRFQRRQPRAHEFLQRRMRSRVQQHLRAIASGASLHRRGRRAEQLHAAQRFVPRCARAPHARISWVRARWRLPRAAARCARTAATRSARVPAAPRQRTPRSRLPAAVSAADARDIPSGSAPRPAVPRARRDPRPARSFAPVARRARKSALNRPWSAFSTTTSVTFGKS